MQSNSMLRRIGLNIRMRRHIMKMTQEQLAEKVGCSRGVISAVERGKRGVSVEMLLAFCRALEYNTAEILRGVE